MKQALHNQEKYYPESLNEVVFVEHFIDKSSADFIELTLVKHFAGRKTNSACIVGLHACADLSITILKLFMNMDFCKGLVIMPCCYHRLKMQNNTDEKEVFENFPISTVFKNVFKEFKAEWFIRRPFLRLACQQNVGNFISMTEEEHRNHSRSFLYRAILEKVVIQGK